MDVRRQERSTEPRPSDRDHLKWLEAAGLALFAGKEVLDLGCGSGYLCAKAIADKARRAVGVDIVDPQVSPEQGAWQFLSVNLDDAAWSDLVEGRFDLILAFDILEHLESPFRFLKSCHEKLLEGGHLVLTTPNCLSWERFCNPRAWSGSVDPQHKILFTRYSLSFLLGRTGYRETKTSAPLRSLRGLAPWAPALGGQILGLAKK